MTAGPPGDGLRRSVAPVLVYIVHLLASGV
jgi:hypothetical protein